MLLELFKRMWGSEPGYSDQFGPSGLPRSIEDDLRRRYLVDGDTPAHTLELHDYEDAGALNAMVSEVEDMFRGLMNGDGVGPTFTLPFEMDDHSGAEQGTESDVRRRMLDDPHNERLRGFFSAPNVPQYNAPLRQSPDQDLDEEAGKGNISIGSLLDDDNNSALTQVPSGWSVPSLPMSSSYKFSSVTTTRKADGTVESKKTVRDSDGNEEVYVTHTIGDQTHTTRRKMDASGAEQTEEEFVNLDQGNAEQFDKAWSALHSAGSMRQLSDADHLSPAELPGLYDSVKQFFKL